MGVRTLRDGSLAAMYCSTTDTAFGPVFYEEDGHDAEDRIEAFIDWLNPIDARHYTEAELRAKYNDFRAQENEYWKAKEKELEDEEGPGFKDEDTD